MKNPISPKVVAAASGAGLLSLLGALVVWIVGVTFYQVPADASHVAEATAAVPSVVALVIVAVFGIIGAGVPGYQVSDPLRATPLDDGPDPDEAPHDEIDEADDAGEADQPDAEPQHALDADGDGQADFADDENAKG